MKKKLNHDELVNLFSTALYDDNTFNVFVDETNKPLKEGLGVCYEDMLANVILNGGDISVIDNYDELDNVNDKSVSNVLKPYQFEWDGQYFFPIYHVNEKRISKAISEILSGQCLKKGKYTKSLLRNYNNLFIEENGDYFDAWNIFQYILFGDCIYG